MHQATSKVEEIFYAALEYQSAGDRAAARHCQPELE